MSTDTRVQQNLETTVGSAALCSPPGGGSPRTGLLRFAPQLHSKMLSTSMAQTPQGSVQARSEGAQRPKWIAAQLWDSATTTTPWSQRRKQSGPGRSDQVVWIATVALFYIGAAIWTVVRYVFDDAAQIVDIDAPATAAGTRLGS